MGEKWPDIIGWFVTMKCWVIVVYSNTWVNWNCGHEDEEIMTITGPFLDGISWRNCREIISLRIRRGCYYFDLEYELSYSSQVSRRKRMNEVHWKKKWSADFPWVRRKGIPLWWDGLWFQLGRVFITFVNLFQWMLREENSFEQLCLEMFRNWNELF
jgi:hypothetical protein